MCFVMWILWRSRNGMSFSSLNFRKFRNLSDTDFITLDNQRKEQRDQWLSFDSWQLCSRHILEHVSEMWIEQCLTAIHQAVLNWTAAPWLFKSFGTEECWELVNNSIISIWDRYWLLDNQFCRNLYYDTNHRLHFRLWIWFWSRWNMSDAR